MKDVFKSLWVQNKTLFGYFWHKASICSNICGKKQIFLLKIFGCKARLLFIQISHNARLLLQSV